MRKFKLIIVIFIFVVSIFALSACAGGDRLTKLEQAISGLESDKSALEDEIFLLNEALTELEKDKKSQDSVIAALRDKLYAAESELEELSKLIEAVGTEIHVQLADEYQLVVGDNFQLFYRSVVRAVNPYGYYIKLEGTVGHQYNRYYEFKPEEIGTYTLKLSVCDSNGNVLGSDGTKLVVSTNKISASENVSKNILCIGDSLTANGVWVSQGIKKYKAAGYTNVKTIGTMNATPISGSSVKYEGHSGWQWSTYVKGGSNETSPFKSSTDASGFSFKEYCTKNGFSGIDELYILLTWNGIGGRFKEFSFTDSLFSNAKIFIDKFHQEYPNAKVTLMSIPLPSVNAGLGAYYEIDISYGDNYAQLCTAMNYNQFMEDWCKMNEYSSFMRYVDAMGQFDSEYNMPTEGKDVNNQNSQDELVGNAMGMHPTNNGYMQIGDVFFRALMKKW